VTLSHICFISMHPKKARLSQLSLTMTCFTECQTFQFGDANSTNFLAAITMFSINRNSNFSAITMIEFCPMQACMYA